MKTWIVVAAGLPLVLFLLLHPEPVATRVQTDALVIAGAAGAYRDASGAPPGSDTRLYWADASAGTVRSSAIDGSRAQTIAIGVGIPYGMAFDAETQALLWTDAASGAVQKLGLAGGTPTSLVTAFEEPYAIDVSGETGQAYYTATGSIVYRNAIDAATGEESSVEVLALPETEQIHGLALDPGSGVLYVGDLNGRMTRRFPLAAKTAQSLPHTETEVPPGAMPGIGQVPLALD